jgi:glucitol operon activator protein
MMFWFVLIGFAVLYVAQLFLALKQAKNYTTTYATMRRKGRVAIGKKKGLFTAGAIVMFQLDDQDAIVAGTRLKGVTVLSRFQDFLLFDGLPLAEVDAHDDRRFSRSLRDAIDNARDNLLYSRTGRIPPEPPGPFRQLADRLRKLTGRKTVPVVATLLREEASATPTAARPLSEAVTAAPSDTAPAPSAKKRIKVPLPR